MSQQVLAEENLRTKWKDILVSYSVSYLVSVSDVFKSQFQIKFQTSVSYVIIPNKKDCLSVCPPTDFDETLHA